MFFKKTTDKYKLDNTVIPNNFYEGWYCGVTYSFGGGLEYASTSGYYHLNEARDIAFKAGYKLGQEQAATAANHRRVGRPQVQSTPKGGRPPIPGEVIAACYGSARIG